MIHQFTIDSTEYFFDGDSLELYRDYVSNEPVTPVARNLFNNYKITFIVTNSCNGQCVYCYQKNKRTKNPSSFMSRTSAEAALNYIIDNNIPIDVVSFFGGEPTLNFPIIQYIVESLEKNNIYPLYEMVTNGVMLDERMREFIISHKFKITFSIDGPDYIHDRLRANCPHSTVIQNFNLLKNSSLKNLEINCTYTAYHEKFAFQDLIDYYTNLNVKYYISNVITDTDWLKINNNFESKQKKILDTCATLLAGITKGGIESHVSAIIDALVHHKYNQMFCSDLCHSLTFDCDGKIYPCNKLLGVCEHDNENLKNLNFKNNEICNQCWAKGICTLCTADLYLNPQKAPYLQEECIHKKLYSFALESLIQYYNDSQDDFQKIVDNYFDSISAE